MQISRWLYLSSSLYGILLSCDLFFIFPFHCINYLMVCEIIFCSGFPDIPDKVGRKQEDEEPRQTIFFGRWEKNQLMMMMKMMMKKQLKKYKKKEKRDQCLRTLNENNSIFYPCLNVQYGWFIYIHDISFHINSRRF